MLALGMSRPSVALSQFSTLFVESTGGLQRAHARRHANCRRLAAATGETGGPEALPPPPLPPLLPPAPASQQQLKRRREVLLYSMAPLVVLGEVWTGDGIQDGRTIVNSLLGAYGLPKFKATPGFRYFDDLDSPYTFQYPKAWVRRKNSMRPGLVISDFDTADNVRVEAFDEPPAGASLAEAAVLKLINPAAQNGGNARLEMPPANRIKTEEREIDGKLYTYVAFPSETITRSGYQVRRKNMAVAAVRKGTVYVLGCSARSDQFNSQKEAVFQQIVDSFRVL